MPPTSSPRACLAPSLVACVLAAAALVPGCASGHHQDAAATGALADPLPAVVTPLHYWESGRRAVDAWLARHPAVAEVALRAEAACVRLEVRTAQHGSSYSESQGSGFLVGGRYVLTSGHTLAGGPAGTARVTLADGRAFDARVLSSSFDVFESTNSDLAVLQVETDADLPSLEIAEPRLGTTALALGYPGKHGLDAAGHVVSGQAYQGAPLRPLIVVTRVEDDSPVVLTPLAGAIITGGMSGSPVVDDGGRVIGILNQSVSSPEVDGVTYTFEAASSVEWAPLLARLRAR